MKTVTLNQYLTGLADCAPDLTSQRHFAKHACHSVAQCLADGGYPARLLGSFPLLADSRTLSRRQLTAWWDAFRAWLRTLTRRELRCLERELVLCPEHLAEAWPPAPAAPRTSRTPPRLAAWAADPTPASVSSPAPSRAARRAAPRRPRRAASPATLTLSEA